MPFKNVAELVETELGAPTTHEINAEVAAVGVTATRFLRQRPHRAAWLIVNLSTANIYIGLTPDVSSTKGILVGPSGGNVILRWKDDYSLTAMEWYAIADAAASTVLIVETLLLASSA